LTCSAPFLEVNAIIIIIIMVMVGGHSRGCECGHERGHINFYKYNGHNSNKPP
jgi:hypothetical protein